MSSSEIKGFFYCGSVRWLPCKLSIKDKLWWRFVPGVVVNVKWPSGKIVAGPGPDDPFWCDLGGANYVTFDSADPNDHYRPWMEKHIGKQGWDWNWGMCDNDVTENRLTIKIRQKYAKYATIAAIRWS